MRCYYKTGFWVDYLLGVPLELPAPSFGSITRTVISPSSGKKLIVPDANGSAIAESLVGVSLMGTDSINESCLTEELMAV